MRPARLEVSWRRDTTATNLAIVCVEMSGGIKMPPVMMVQVTVPMVGGCLVGVLDILFV